MCVKCVCGRLARRLGLTHSASLQKRAIQFGTRIANKNVCGAATLDASIDLAEVVHPSAAAGRAASGIPVTSCWRVPTDGSNAEPEEKVKGVRARLSKKKGNFGSTRAAPPAGPALTSVG